MNKPEFNTDTGYLITGIHQFTIDELLDHPILGKTIQRKNLIYSLEEACEAYWSYGIDEIYTNGSFATMKPVPNDIDGYIVVDTMSENFKELVNSDSIWGQFKGKHHEKDKMPMWYEHKIEFYIEHTGFFHNFFTHSREGIERGIIKIIR